MKILGIGIDIVENIRIHKSLKNVNFIKRVFSSSEILLAENITNTKSYYSKGFAAKEENRSEKEANSFEDNQESLSDNLSDELSKLNNLKESGVITQEEFIKAKNKLLND